MRSGRPAPRWGCSTIFSATSTLTPSPSRRGRRARARSGRSPPAARPAGPPAAWVSPPNITCAICAACAAQRRVERRVAVAVDRRPPRRHAVDELGAVRQPQAHADGADRRAGPASGRSSRCRGARGARGRTRAGVVRHARLTRSGRPSVPGAAAAVGRVVRRQRRLCAVLVAPEHHEAVVADQLEVGLGGLALGGEVVAEEDRVGDVQRDAPAASAGASRGRRRCGSPCRGTRTAPSPGSSGSGPG